MRTLPDVETNVHNVTKIAVNERQYDANVDRPDWKRICICITHSNGQTYGITCFTNDMELTIDETIIETD